jgi:hypothetical protein
MSIKTKAVLKRFLKGAIAGAIGQMAIVTYQAPVVWTDVISILNLLALAGITGAIGGVLLAGQKWASWK